MGMDPQTSGTEICLYSSLFIIKLPRTEIPKRLKLNHESDGNVISFWVGRKFPNIFFVCFAFRPLKYPWTSLCHVYLSINGCKKEYLFTADTDELSDHLWMVSLSNMRLQDQLNNSNPSERNYVEVICETLRWGKGLDTMTGLGQYVVVDWIKNHPRGWGGRCRVHLSMGFQQWRRFQTSMRRRNHPPTYAKRPQKHYLSHFEWLRIRFRLWKRSSRPTLPIATLMSRALREMEEIDPRAFNNRAEDSGLAIAHTFVNDGSNSMLYPPSKKARKS